MAPPLTVRNLTPVSITIQRVERFEDPSTLQSKPSGYFLGSQNSTSAAPTSPELSGHAQSFNHQDLDILLQPFESYTLRFQQYVYCFKSNPSYHGSDIPW
jgi:1-phosphatidylinositol phosphodiesterase